MGLRTYYRGIRYSGDIRSLFRPRNAENPYTTYAGLKKGVSEGRLTLEQARANLRTKVDQGFISLEELVSGGRATTLFEESGLFPEAVEKLSRRRAAVLLRDADKLRRFLISGKASVPFVVEHLPADGVAIALHRASKPVQQQSVNDLKRTNNEEVGAGYRKATFELIYDKTVITTEHFPGDLEKIFCFRRNPTEVVAINRGLAITDRFVSNFPAILDALAKLKTSPLDCILVYFRRLEGRMYPLLPSVNLLYTNDWGMREEEFVSRDHFTEKARTVLHELVSSEFGRMQQESGNPLSFRVYISRGEYDGKFFYGVEISWKKARLSP